MAIKKNELYNSLWKSCDELRGGMDASQYKDYVLVLLFVKYVSDKYADQPGALIEVPKGCSFADMVALKGDKEIGDKINKIISKLADANDLHHVIDVADFNDADKLGRGREMQDRLSNLVAVFDNLALNVRKNRAEGNDILVDAYEYLMYHFATESGKSKGQFYTPSEVSRIIANVIGIDKASNQSQTIYDPTCGSGSLLLKVADEIETGDPMTICGQEMDNATAILAKMNMILHDNPTAEIWQDNSLSRPYFKDNNGNLKTFDFVVADPPFSNKAWSNGFDPYNDPYDRFVDGVPPAKNGDYAFLLHIIRSLKSTGKGAIILPQGVLFRGNAEANIRRNIIRKGYIKGIIRLPANLFYGTDILACIIIIDKQNAENRRSIFMIDASKGFVLDSSKNRLRHQDIHKIVNVFNRQLEIPMYSRTVSMSEIEENSYNLSIPLYIDNAEGEDLRDIKAHPLGGIPNRDIDALDIYWQVCPTLRQKLFAAGLLPGYSQLKMDIAQIETMIFTHPESIVYIQTVTALFEQWRTTNTLVLKSIGVGSHPKQLIDALSEDILQVFAQASPIDKYNFYQLLMTHWSDTMQDDVYMIVQDVWKGNNDLIPPYIIIHRYFASELQTIEQLQVARKVITHKIEEMSKEHSGEGGLLEEAQNEKGKITKFSIQVRLKDIFAASDAEDERTLLNAYLDLLEQEIEAKKKIKEAQNVLDKKVRARYKLLSEDEVKALVVEDKWLTKLASDVQSELNHFFQVLIRRIKELAERHATALSKYSEDIKVLRDLEEQQSNPTSVVKIFYCYAHEDRTLRDQLDKHMEPLKRSGKIVTWYDREILPGAEWKYEIDRHLKASKIVLLLVSPDFIKSDYCYGVEMQRAFLMHTMNIAQIIPIILRPVNWKETPLNKLQVVPHGGKPVTTWRNRDEVLQSIVAEIQKVVDLFLERNNDKKYH